MLRPTFALLLALALTSTLPAGEYNPVLSIGDAAPAWKDLPGVDGKKHSLADLKKKQYVVVVFTCNSCPYAVDYEQRQVEFAKKHCGPDGNVALVAINVNKVEEDSPEAMKERAEEVGFNFPYLYDETQNIAREYGATFTPEYFLLGPDRKILYMGALDDNTNPEKAQINYVEAAMQSAAAGQEIKVQETVARGCLVRYERRRRSRAK